MDYRIVKKRTEQYSGLENTTVAVNKKLYTIKNTSKLDNNQLTIAIYNEIIRCEPSMAKKQSIARERYNFEQSI